MSKPVKELITNDLRSRYHGQDTALWIEIVGADGVTTNNFRRELRAKGIRLEIVKNSLLRRACADGPLAPMANALAGPAALVTGGESLIDAAKLIEEWIRKIKGMKLRGAVLEGEYLDEQAVTGLSRMPTRRELHARVSGTIAAPGANLAAALLAGGRSIAGCLKVLIEKLEGGESAAAA